MRWCRALSRQCSCDGRQKIWLAWLSGSEARGEADLPATPPAPHLVDTLLQLLGGRSGGHGEHLVSKQVVVHAGHGSTQRPHVIIQHHGHLGRGHLRVQALGRTWTMSCERLIAADMECMGLD